MDPQPHKEPKAKASKKKLAEHKVAPVKPAAAIVATPPEAPAATAPTATTPTAIAQATSPAPQLPSQSKALAITALVLALVSVLIGIAWFLAAPLAIAAVIMGIIVLAKNMAGKGMGIAALATGSVSLLLFIPFWFAVTVIVVRDIQQATQDLESRANGPSGSSEQRRAPSDKELNFN